MAWCPLHRQTRWWGQLIAALYWGSVSLLSDRWGGNVSTAATWKTQQMVEVKYWYPWNVIDGELWHGKECTLECDWWHAINRSTINTAPPHPEVQLPVPSTRWTSASTWFPSMCVLYAISVLREKIIWIGIWMPSTSRMVWNMNALIVEKHLIARTTWNSTNPSAKPFDSSVPDAIVFYGI